MLDQLGLAPEQVLFFDDNQTNIEAAWSMGIAAKQVSSPGDVLEELERAKLFQDLP